MSDTIVTTFCYDWCNNQNGRAYCNTPFYLSGYGLIDNEGELNEALSALRFLEARNVRQAISWKELSSISLPTTADFIDKQVRSALSNEDELSVVPTLIGSRAGNSVWLFILKDNKVVGIIK